MNQEHDNQNQLSSTNDAYKNLQGLGASGILVDEDGNWVDFPDPQEPQSPSNSTVTNSYETDKSDPSYWAFYYDERYCGPSREAYCARMASQHSKHTEPSSDPTPRPFYYDHLAVPKPKSQRTSERLRITGTTSNESPRIKPEQSQSARNFTFAKGDTEEKARIDEIVNETFERIEKRERANRYNKEGSAKNNQPVSIPKREPVPHHPLEKEMFDQLIDKAIPPRKNPPMNNYSKVEKTWSERNHDNHHRSLKTWEIVLMLIAFITLVSLLIIKSYP